MHAESAFIFVVLLFTVSSTMAQQNSPTPNQEETQSGTISGKVVGDGNQSLAGATIFVQPVNSITQSRVVSADSEGNFQITSLEPALYRIFASVPAYTPPIQDLDEPQIYYRVGDNARVELVKGGVITGTVTNNAGDPVVAVRVRATMVPNSKGQPIKSGNVMLFERATDDRGIYRIYGITPGTYIVSAGGGSPGPYPSGPYSIDPYRDEIPTYAPSTTRDNAAEIVVRSGEETNIDIHYRGEPGHVVSGKVRTSGTQGVSLSLTAVGAGLTSSINSYQMDGHRFAIPGVADGEYDLVAFESLASSILVTQLAMSDPMRITVKGSDVTGLDIATKPLAAVSGRIILGPSKIPECEGKRRPVFNEMLMEVTKNQKPNDDPVPFLRVFGTTASPDKEGMFVFPNLRPGQYVVYPRFFARYWYLQSITVPGQAAHAGVKAAPVTPKTDSARNWISVKGGEPISGLTLTIAEGAGSIRGKIVVGEGTRVPDRLSIYLVPAEREKAEDVLRFFIARVEPNGTFALNSLPPGRYWSIAQVENDGELSIGKLRLPANVEARTKLRQAAELLKKEVEIKACQNVNDFQLPLK